MSSIGIDFAFRSIIGEVEKIISPDGLSAKDRCWPLLTVKKMGGDGVLRSDVALELTKPIPIGNKYYFPVSFGRAKERDAFLRHTGIEKHPQIADDFFPLRTNLPYRKLDDTVIFGSSELHLSARLANDGQERFFTLLRDSKAAFYPDCFTSPGGMLDRAPLVGSISECNEELSLVVRQGGKFFALFPEDSGQHGITEEDKRSRLPLTLERLQKQHPSIFANVSTEDIELLPVKLEENETFAPHHVNVTVDCGDLRYTGRHLGSYEEPIRAASLQRALKLPKEAGGVSLQNLIWGENLFGADSESPHFERIVYPLTIEEILYARYPSGKEYEKTDLLPEGVPAHGALISIMRSLTELAEEMGIKPASEIKSWTKDGEQRMVLAPKPVGSEGGRYTLIPLPDLRRPVPMPAANADELKK